MKIANEVNADSGASQGHQAVVGGEQIGVSIEEDGMGFVKSDALAAANGNGVMAHLLEAGSSVHGVDEILRLRGVSWDSGNETFLGTESVNAKEISDEGRESVGPPTVAINVTSKSRYFRGKMVVAAVGGGGMVLTLKRIA